MGEMKIAGVVLAGGKSRRMGFLDKCLLEIDGKKIIKYVIDKAIIQIDEDNLVLNTNSKDEAYQKFGLEVISDIYEDYRGPLAGILSAMKWANNKVDDREWLICFAGDCPFYPDDIFARLLSRNDALKYDVIMPRYGGRGHPVLSAFSFSLMDEIFKVVDKGERLSVKGFIDKRRVKIVEFDDYAYDPFFNINTQDDLKKAQKLMTEIEASSKNNLIINADEI